VVFASESEETLSLLGATRGQCSALCCHRADPPEADRERIAGERLIGEDIDEMKGDLQRKLY
jgi:hypothetical protein